MSNKEIRYEKVNPYREEKFGRSHVRRNYSKVLTSKELPNLIGIQSNSFKWFMEEGLGQLFRDISPIKDRGDGEKFELSFLSHEFREPKLSIEQARVQDANYSRQLFCKVQLENKITGDVKEEDVFMGDFPVMTPQGTFIIHGSERVIVTQIVRSSSAFFSVETDKKSGQEHFSGQVIPTRGAWIEYSMGAKDIWYANFNKSSNISLVTFIRALGVSTNTDMMELFFGTDTCNSSTEGYVVPQNLLTCFYNTALKDQTFGVDEAVIALYKCVKPGEQNNFDNSRKALASLLFDPRHYDLAKVGRYKINEKLDVIKRAINCKLAFDLVDENGNVLIYKGEEISHKSEVIRDGDKVFIDTVEILEANRHLLRKTFKYDLMLEGDSVTLEVLDVITKTANEDVFVRLLGNDQTITSLNITLSDIISSISYYLNLHVGIGSTDDIDHLGNRRLRLIGEFLQMKARNGLISLEKQIRDKMSTTVEVVNVDPGSLINNRKFIGPITEFFTMNQLSQFMDQINPLAELTNKRRISALGDGGIARDRAGFEVRDVHPSHYGRICPVETPEGQNIGLISSLASYSQTNEYGFIITPYFVVKNNLNSKEYKEGKEPLQVWITDEIKYLDACEEEKHAIAQANVTMRREEGTGRILIVDDKVLARRNAEFSEMNKEDVEFVDVSPKQVVAVGTACIPFLEHDDTTRALMGANMQRQAIPLLHPEAPIVGTGIEAKVAHDAGVALIADVDGVVKYVDGNKIKVQPDDGSAVKEYKLVKFERSNDSTCVNQKPIVIPGEKVKVGDVLADGQSMEQGELALGRNVVIAFMTWQGYNFEDAVIMSERMVQDDVYTSIHIEQYTCEARDTKLGKETITNELDGESKDSIAHLDENGIIIIGTEVQEGDTLVGKLTPKGTSEPTPEERLSLALFPDLSKEVRVTSLKVPHGGGGVVSKIEHFVRKKDDVELAPGVNEVVRVFIVQKRKISEGDKMSGRHGNKGVISNIVPIEDMPFMSDGTPVDIMLNPQGVPSRMNIGQVLEVHLGMAAKKLGVKVATPVFDGVTKQDLVDIMNEAREKDLKDAELDPRNEHAIIDENGKTFLYDGRTGRPFDHKICVGVMYMIKLCHMVDDKIHARSEGPYTLVTQQPMGGKAQNGGQRFGEMEVWALEAYGAAYTLQEMMTIKSDDIIGRNKVYKSIVDGAPIPEAGIPEAFRAMIKELQGLGLSIKLIDQEGNNVANKSLVDEFAEAIQANKINK